MKSDLSLSDEVSESSGNEISLCSDDAVSIFVDEISESSYDKEKISFGSDKAVCKFFAAHSSHRRASLPDNITSNLPAVKEPRTTRHRRVTFVT